MSRPPQMSATAPTEAPVANTQIGNPRATATMPATTRAITTATAALTTTYPRGAVTACCQPAARDSHRHEYPTPPSQLGREWPRY